MPASRVHPAATPRAVFCTICSLSMFVSDALGDHMVEVYSRTGLVMALYVASMVSLCLPHLVKVRTLSMLIVLRDLVAARSMCLLQVNLGSRVSHSIFGCVVMGSVALSTRSPSCVLYSAGSGASSVHAVPSVPRSRSLSPVHPSMSCR